MTARRPHLIFAATALARPQRRTPDALYQKDQTND